MMMYVVFSRRSKKKGRITRPFIKQAPYLFQVAQLALQCLDILFATAHVFFHGFHTILVLGVIALVATPLRLAAIEFLLQVRKLLFFILHFIKQYLLTVVVARFLGIAVDLWKFGRRRRRFGDNRLHGGSLWRR